MNDGYCNTNGLPSSLHMVCMEPTSGWTAEEMGDMSGKTVVVTGANSGLGYEAAREFATHGASVVLACRDTEHGTEAGERIREQAPDAPLTVIELDLFPSSTPQPRPTSMVASILDRAAS